MTGAAQPVIGRHPRRPGLASVAELTGALATRLAGHDLLEAAPR